MLNSRHIIRVSIDIGNTRTHIGIINAEEFKCLNRIDILSKDSEKYILKYINELHKQSNTPGSSTVIVSSVIRSQLEKVTKQLIQNKMEVKQFCYSEKLPIKINYKNPEMLGTDRIANALYGFSRFKGENLVLISAGTALTVDLLCGEQYQGGAILPGPAMQFQSLHKGTDALPEVNENKTCKLPGNSTEECMRAGVLFGAGGALNNIVDRYRNIVSGNLRIIATGGAWPLLTDYLDFEYSFFPDMTLLGISLFADLQN